MGPVNSPARQFDDFPGSGIELLSITELCAQSRTDSQTVRGLNAEVAPVEHDVHIRSQQKAVVETVLTAVCYRPDVRRLEHRRNMRTGDRALAPIGAEHDGFERLLAKPVWREPWVTKDGTGPMPWCG